MTLNFPASPTSGTTAWRGEQLFQYDGTTNSWNQTMDLTPLHHWRLNDTVNVASDSGTNPIAGSMVGCILSQTGVISRGVSFTGTSSYVLINSSTSVNCSPESSIFCWMKSTTASGQIIERRFGSNLYYLAIGSGSGPLLFALGNGVTTPSTLSTTYIIDGVWHNIGFTYSENEMIARAYIDGKQASTISLTGCTGAGTQGDLHFGDENGAGFYNGLLEDVRFYNRALTQQEISAIYEQGRGTYSHTYIKGFPTVKTPIHHWRLNELTGTVVNDSGSSPVPLSGSASTGQTGIFDTSYLFTNTYTSCAIENIQATLPKFSGSLWFNAISTAGNKFLVNWTLPYGLGYSCEINSNTVTWGAGTGSVNQYLYASISSSTWYNASYVNDSASLKLYLNGALVAQTTTVFNIPTVTTVVFGKYAAALTTPSYAYSGQMQDVRIYDYALSPTEIQNLYNNGRGTRL